MQKKKLILSLQATPTIAIDHPDFLQRCILPENPGSSTGKPEQPGRSTDNQPKRARHV